MEHLTKSNEPDSDDGKVSSNAWNEGHALSDGDCIVVGLAKIRIGTDGGVTTLSKRGRIYTNFGADGVGVWSASAVLGVPMTANGIGGYFGMASVMPLGAATGYSVDVDTGSDSVIVTLSDAGGSPANPPVPLTIFVAVYVACSIPIAPA